MVVRILAILLVFSASAYSASASFTATADGFVYAGAETTTFFISVDSTDANVSATYINEALTTRNYGSATTLLGGRTSSSGNRKNICLRWDRLDDTIRNYVDLQDADKIIVDTMWARLYLTTAPAASNQTTITAYPLTVNRPFVEGASNNAVGCGADWDSCTARYTGSCGETKIDWTTNGGLGGLGGDYNGSGMGSVAFTSSSTTSQYYSWVLTGSDLEDSLNLAGIILIGGSYGASSGNASATFSADGQTNPPTLWVKGRYIKYKNYGGADSVMVGGSTSQYIGTVCFDLSTLPTCVVESTRIFWNGLADYSVNSEGAAGVYFSYPLKPIKTGDNNGTVADAGEMTDNAWDNRGSLFEDSLWGTSHIANNSTTFCNRSDGADGDFISPAGVGQTYISGTGAKSALVDTSLINTYLRGGCSTPFSLLFRNYGTAGDYGFYKVEAIENTGTSPMSLTIYYHEVSSYGRGRWGKLDTGEMINERID